MSIQETYSTENLIKKAIVDNQDGTTSIKTSLKGGDIQLGAVEIKNATTDDRAEVVRADAAKTGATKVLVTQNIDSSGNIGGGSSPSTTADYKSPSDFSAAYTSNITITLSGVPITITDNSQIKYIMMVPAAGQAKIFVNGSGGVTITHAANVLTISGAGTPFTAGDVYEVGINSQQKAYDPSTNSTMVSPLKNVWNQQVDEQTLIENAALTATFTQIGSDIDVRGFPILQAGVVVAVGTSTDIKLKIVQKLADGSYLPIDGYSEITLTESKSYKFDLPAIETVAFQVKDAAAGTGTVSLYYNQAWR